MASGSTQPISVPPWASLASGAASGAASCLLLQPMDLLKTRMQQESSSKERRVAASSTATEATSNQRGGGASKRTKRLVTTAKQVFREDGWRGFWRGTVPTVARNVPGVAMYFYSVSEVRALIARSATPILSLPVDGTPPSSTASPASNTSKASTLARLTVYGNLASGAVARVAVGFLLSPVTIVKARFESSHFSKDAYPSLSRALLQIYQHDGVKGLFRGFTATAMRDAPYAGIYLACYESTKDALGKWEAVGGRGSGSTIVISASGMFAGALATLVTHPFDIIKTRMQTSPSDAINSGVDNIAQRRSSMIKTCQDILRVDGKGAFLDGLGLRCARKAASSAIGWTIFEAGRRMWVAAEMKRREEDEACHLTSSSTQ